MSPRVCLLLLAMPLCAQNAGSIAGRLTDPDGGPVATASLQFKNSVTGAVLQATSKADGTYALVTPPGSYDLTIPTIGFTFKRYVQNGIVVEAGQTRRLDISLPWGGNLGTPGDDIAILIRSRSPAP